MSNFFNQIKHGAKNIEAQYLGPTYEYPKHIRNPQELGMSGKGNLSALARDVNGLIQYTRILIEGDGQANKVGRPLGNRFFLKTGGRCTASGGNKHDRYIYINNVPLGSIPFMSNLVGSNVSMFRGIVPGTIENVGSMNPLALFGGFMQGKDPPCRKLSLPSDVSPKSAYVADADIADLDPCLWAKGKEGYNPVSKKKRSGCQAGFQNINNLKNGINNTENKSKEIHLTNNSMANLYNLGFGTLLIYIFFNLLSKKKL